MKGGSVMFLANVTIPQSYEYVNYNTNKSDYEDIIKKVIDSCNNNSNGDNTIVIGDYSMLKKSFSELFDKNTNKRIQLLKKIDFIISSDENGFYYENKQFNIYVYGENQKEAEDNIFEELLFQYNNYVYEDDDKLDTNALKLKYDLLSIINLHA